MKSHTLLFSSMVSLIVSAAMRVSVVHSTGVTFTGWDALQSLSHIPMKDITRDCTRFQIRHMLPRLTGISVLRPSPACPVQLPWQPWWYLEYIFRQHKRIRSLNRQ